VSFIPVMGYIGGIFTFGFLYWLLDGIRKDIQVVATTGDTYDLLLMMWGALLIVYLIFGGVWVIRKYNEDQYRQGGGF